RLAGSQSPARMCSLRSFFSRMLAGFFEYRLQKVVVIRSVKFGLFYRSVQLSVIVYFLFYIIWHKKGYQVIETPEGGVVFKVKGLDFVNRSGDPDYGARVWDSADYIIPPIMNGAIFITTNARVTDKQAMSECPESVGHCHQDGDCLAGSISSQGRRTGRCSPDTRTCISYGWCPAPSQDAFNLPVGSVLTRARNFTVQLKNSVDFRAFDKKRRNILDWMTSEYLNTCLYDKAHPNLTYCPVFRLGDILAYSGTTSEEVYKIGGAFGIDISWQCNFDLPEEHCLPKYHFRELDIGKGTDIEGFSVQYAYNYRSEGQDRRMLVHAYGIKIFVTVSGEGGRFDFYRLSMNLGSGLALFGLSSMLCDVILLRIASQKQRASLQRARVDYCDVGRRRRRSAGGTKKEDERDGNESKEEDQDEFEEDDEAAPEELEMEYQSGRSSEDVDEESAGEEARSASRRRCHREQRRRRHRQRCQRHRQLNQGSSPVLRQWQQQQQPERSRTPPSPLLPQFAAAGVASKALPYPPPPPPLCLQEPLLARQPPRPHLLADQRQPPPPYSTGPARLVVGCNGCERCSNSGRRARRLGPRYAESSFCGDDFNDGATTGSGDAGVADFGAYRPPRIVRRYYGDSSQSPIARETLI
ncbi:hypothetical protein BOX15_Mlig019017g3, partial [Macrostomum lignano]